MIQHIYIKYVSFIVDSLLRINRHVPDSTRRIVSSRTWSVILRVQRGSVRRSESPARPVFPLWGLILSRAWNFLRVVQVRPSCSPDPIS